MQGLHLLSDPFSALREIERVLAPTGRLRGSMLLRPRRAGFWMRLWRTSGLALHDISEENFQAWVRNAGLTVLLFERHGDMCVFELAPICH